MSLSWPSSTCSTPTGWVGRGPGQPAARPRRAAQRRVGSPVSGSNRVEWASAAARVANTSRAEYVDPVTPSGRPRPATPAAACGPDSSALTASARARSAASAGGSAAGSAAVGGRERADQVAEAAEGTAGGVVEHGSAQRHLEHPFLHAPAPSPRPEAASAYLHASGNSSGQNSPGPNLTTGGAPALSSVRPVLTDLTSGSSRDSPGRPERCTLCRCQPPAAWRTVTDGPLIVQSDKTLLLEVDHPLAAGGPRGDRAVRRAGALARARPHLPADPARAVERPRRRPRRRAGRRRAGPLLAGTRCRTRCWSTSPTPWTGTAGSSWSSTRRTAWCWSAWTGPCWRRSLRQQEDRADARRSASTTTPSLVHPSRARPAQAGAAQGRLAGRGPGRLRRRRGARRSRCDEDGWQLRDYQQRGGGRRSGPAAPAWSCCPAAPARRWSARRRWPRRRRPR